MAGSIEMGDTERNLLKAGIDNDIGTEVKPTWFKQRTQMSSEIEQFYTLSVSDEKDWRLGFDNQSEASIGSSVHSSSQHLPLVADTSCVSPLSQQSDVSSIKKESLSFRQSLPITSYPIKIETSASLASTEDALSSDATREDENKSHALPVYPLDWSPRSEWHSFPWPTEDDIKSQPWIQASSSLSSTNGFVEENENLQYYPEQP